MDWLQAQSMARGGKNVARAGWPITKQVSDNSGTLEVTDERLFTGPYYPSAEDAQATDWAAVDPALLPLAAAVQNTGQLAKVASDKHDAATAECDAADAVHEEAKAAYVAAGGVLPPPEAADPPPPPADEPPVEGARSSLFGGKKKK